MIKAEWTPHKESRKNNVETNLFLYYQRKQMLQWELLEEINTEQEAEDHARIQDFTPDSSEWMERWKESLHLF